MFNLQRWLAFLFSFRGRIRRATFGLIVLGYAVYVVVVIVAVETLLPRLLAGLWSFVMWLPATLVFITAVVRRLHDRGRSAAWLAVFFGLPFLILLFLGFPLGLAHQNESISPAFFYAGMALILVPTNLLYWWGVVEICFLRGTKGENRFGPDPLTNHSDQLTLSGAPS
jgi:uncharacterized membrane protein YhaH (DUF805 family)